MPLRSSFSRSSSWCPVLTGSRTQCFFQQSINLAARVQILGLLFERPKSCLWFKKQVAWATCFVKYSPIFFKVIGTPSKVHGQEILMLSGPTAKVYVISFKESARKHSREGTKVSCRVAELSKVVLERTVHLLTPSPTVCAHVIAAHTDWPSSMHFSLAAFGPTNWVEMPPA